MLDRISISILPVSPEKATGLVRTYCVPNARFRITGHAPHASPADPPEPAGNTEYTTLYCRIGIYCRRISTVVVSPSSVNCKLARTSRTLSNTRRNGDPAGGASKRVNRGYTPCTLLIGAAAFAS